MAGNVHKDEVSAIKIPFIATQEDRGLSRCGKPIKALATLTSTERHKNDITGIALIADNILVELEDDSGALTLAPGISVSFPYQSNAVGFVIDWRQVTRNGGTEIATGCYRVRVSGTISGIAFSYYYAAFDLDVWSFRLAKHTLQVFSVLNDVVRKDAINYKDSGFANTVRFKGTFGYMQPNYETTNLTYTDRSRKKVNNEALRTYELRTSYLLGCLTEMIDEQHLLAANNIWITEHNPLAHIQYIEFPVIIDEETSPNLEYPPGEYAKLTAVFKDKVAVHQSKYDGNIEATENVSFALPNALFCTGLTANVSVNGTLEGSTDTSSIDVLLSNSGGTVAPVSVNITGSDVSIVVPDASPAPVGCDLLTTNQTTSYGDYDDGDLEEGREVDFFTLENPNPFGNTNAFTDELGGQSYSNDIVIDWKTYNNISGKVLGYYRVVNSGSWDTARVSSNSLSVGTFINGWRLTNVRELFNLTIYEGATGNLPLNYSPLNIATATFFWTSTTNAATTANAMVMQNNTANATSSASKALTFPRYISCRTFTVTGTILT